MKASFVALCLPLLAAAAPAKRQAAAIDTITSIIYETEVVATKTVWVDGPLPTITAAPSSASVATTLSSVVSSSSSAASSVSSVSSVLSTVNAYSVPTHAPTTSSYVAPPPAPTTPAYVAPTTSAAPAPAPSPSAPSGGSSSSPMGYGPFSGDLTAYDDAGTLACGGSFSSDAAIVAISHTTFDQFTPGGNPNDNTLCGTSITLTYNGNSFPATIQDRCTGCNPGDLDLPEGFWSQVTGGQPYGRLAVTWHTN